MIYVYIWKDLNISPPWKIKAEPAPQDDLFIKLPQSKLALVQVKEHKAGSCGWYPNTIFHIDMW